MSAKSCQLQLTPLAKADLEEIWLYTFEHWSLEQADKYLRDLVSTMELLANGAKIGRICPANNRYFQYAVSSHIVFYQVNEDTIGITRVLHQRMDAERHL